MPSSKKTTRKPADKEQNGYTQRAYNGLRRMLFFNEIAPGHKIYYRDVAEELSMSPTPVIQALKWLEFHGLVRHEPNRGFFLEPISLDEIIEIYALREMLEVNLLAGSFDQRCDEVLEKVKAALDRYVESFKSTYPKEQTIAAMQFHLSIAELSKSPISMRFLKTLFDLTYLKYQVDSFYVRHSNQGVGRHAKIVELILEGDKEGACQALREDIRNVRDIVVSGIKQSLEQKEKVAFILE